MKLKTVEVDGKTFAEVSDGKPVYVHDDGKEIAFDAPGTVSTLSATRGEAMRNREAKEAAEKALKAFEGITDAAAARKALDTVAGLDAKKLIDAGEVDRVKAEIAKGYETKLQEAEAKAQALEGQLYSEKIGGAFARSKYIADHIAVPSDMIQSTFGSRFKVEDGKTVAYDQSGNRIYSRARPGELADFEEALETIIGGYAYKDSILKGSNANGSGAAASSGGGSTAKTMSLKDFSALSAKERADRMANGVTLTE